MSKASYRTKQSTYIGAYGHFPRRWITLKVYRRYRRMRLRYAKQSWKEGLDLRSIVGQHVEYWPVNWGKEGGR